MESVLGNVASGEVTVAVDTQLNGQSDPQDDYMGIVDGEIVAVVPTVAAAAERWWRLCWVKTAWSRFCTADGKEPLKPEGTDPDAR